MNYQLNNVKTEIARLMIEKAPQNKGVLKGVVLNGYRKKNNPKQSILRVTFNLKEIDNNEKIALSKAMERLFRYEAACSNLLLIEKTEQQKEKAQKTASDFIFDVNLDKIPLSVINDFKQRYEKVGKKNDQKYQHDFVHLKKVEIGGQRIVKSKVKKLNKQNIAKLYFDMTTHKASKDLVAFTLGQIFINIQNGINRHLDLEEIKEYRDLCIEALNGFLEIAPNEEIEIKYEKMNGRDLISEGYAELRILYSQEKTVSEKEINGFFSELKARLFIFFFGNTKQKLNFFFKDKLVKSKDCYIVRLRDSKKVKVSNFDLDLYFDLIYRYGESDFVGGGRYLCHAFAMGFIDRFNNLLEKNQPND